MLEKPLQIVELFQSLDQFFQVFQPPRCLGCLVGQPHRRIAGFLQYHLGQIDMGAAEFIVGQQRVTVPAADVVDEMAQLTAAFAPHAAR